jgi:hypothetical protein
MIGVFAFVAKVFNERSNQKYLCVSVPLCIVGTCSQWLSSLGSGVG